MMMMIFHILKPPNTGIISALRIFVFQVLVQYYTGTYWNLEVSNIINTEPMNIGYFVMFFVLIVRLYGNL